VPVTVHSVKVPNAHVVGSGACTKEACKRSGGVLAQRRLAKGVEGCLHKGGL